MNSHQRHVYLRKAMRTRNTGMVRRLHDRFVFLWTQEISAVEVYASITSDTEATCLQAPSVRLYGSPCAYSLPLRLSWTAPLVVKLTRVWDYPIRVQVSTAAVQDRFYAEMPKFNVGNVFYSSATTVMGHEATLRIDPPPEIKPDERLIAGHTRLVQFVVHVDKHEDPYPDLFWDFLKQRGLCARPGVSDTAIVQSLLRGNNATPRSK